MNVGTVSIETRLGFLAFGLPPQLVKDPYGVIGRYNCMVLLSGIQYTLFVFWN